MTTIWQYAAWSGFALGIVMLGVAGIIGGISCGGIGGYTPSDSECIASASWSKPTMIIAMGVVLGSVLAVVLVQQVEKSK